MYPYILIIFNPTSSSGKAKVRAERLARQLRRRKIKHVHLKASEYANHSEVLAYQTTKKYLSPLIISVSGDGGYNEVINGAIKARIENPKLNPVCAILGAGNANDHRRALGYRPLVWGITHNQPAYTDILRLNFGHTTRYAHSYIGVGPTAETAAELNREKLTRWKEIKIVARNLLNFRHFAIIDNNERRREVDSVVFANIHRMSKFLKLNTKTDLHDGLFNVFVVPHRSRFKFLFLLLKLVVFGVKNPPQMSNFNFQLTKHQLGHLDGEVIALPANANINVSIESKLLLTLS